MRYIKALVPSLAFAFGVVAGGCESKTELARKPGLVDSLVTQSVELCDIERARDGISYESRLRKALLECRTNDLAVLKDHNIVITFDQRLSKQDLGIFDNEMRAVFYNNANASGTLALWDNGMTEESYWKRDPYERVSEIVAKLADEIKDGVSPDMQVGIAQLVSYRSGKTTRHKIVWKEADDFDRDTRRKNEAILRRGPRRKGEWEGSGGGW